MIGKEMIMGGGLDLNMEVAGIVFNAVHQQILVKKLRSAKLVVHVHRPLGPIAPPSLTPLAAAARSQANSDADPQLLLLMLVIVPRVASAGADPGEMIDVEGKPPLYTRARSTDGIS